MNNDNKKIMFYSKSLVKAMNELERKTKSLMYISHPQLEKDIRQAIKDRDLDKLMRLKTEITILIKDVN